MINTGKYYRRLYESDWSVFRRFYFANPIFCDNDIDNELKRYVTEKYPELDHSSFSRYDYILEINYPGTKPYHLFKSSFSLPETHSVSRICPECEKQLFHSYIFSFYWITHCPIHNVALTTPIPSNNYWNPMFRRYKDAPDLESIIDRSNIVDMDTEPFHLLYKIIAKKPYKKYESILISPCLWDILGIHNTQIEYPSVLENISKTENAILKRYGVKRYPVKVISSNLTKYRKRPTNPYHIFYRDKSYLLSHWAMNIRKSMVKFVVDSINNVCAPGHKVSLCYKADNRCYKETCPYCLSFSLWFYRILGDSHKRGSKRYTDCIYTDFYEFDPDPPSIITTIEYQNQIFNLPPKLFKLLYKKNIEWLFYNIYSYVAHVVKYFITNESEETGYKSSQQILRTLPSHAEPDNIGFRDVFWRIHDREKIIFQYLDGYHLKDLLKENGNIYTEICNNSREHGFGLHYIRECNFDYQYQDEAIELAEKHDLIRSNVSCPYQYSFYF